MKNYYQILEINENASLEIIEKAYKVLAKKYHPDLYPQDKLYYAESKFKEITEAYNILSNNDLRQEYDIRMGFNTGSYDNRYDNLYNENQTLKRKLNSFKTNNKTQKYEDNSKDSDEEDNNRFSFLKKYPATIKQAIYNELKKPKEERSKDFLALLITVIIISILILIFWKVPFLHKLIFL